MRTNLPVTQQEYEFPDGETLVSMTDLQSRITYCNPSFVRVSGYTNEELIGEPHNLVRHPDMPQEAFRDMWRTVGQCKPWSALVKNRRKNGDHYWVVANVTPIVENGKPVGYLSVRTQPTRAQVAGATALYAQMREQEAAKALRIRLSAGRVMRTGLAGLWQRLTSLGLRARVASALVLPVVAIASAGAIVTGPLSWVAQLAAAAVAFGAAFMWLDRSVIASLGHLVRRANTIAAGDLSHRTDSTRHDEIGQLHRALNQLNVNLQAVVGDVRREVDGVESATREIATGNQDLSARTESQAASLEETAASVEQLASTVTSNSQTAKQADAVASEASGYAAAGGDAVRKVVAAMDQINVASKRIAEIIGVIDGIAFQTNILALNAAVEAARAGEQGRGFAVVAGEVRALAQRSANAAREIKALIEQSVGKADDGVHAVDEAGRVIDRIVASVASVGGLVADIARASVEQSAGIGQINTAISQLDSVTQSNAALVEQAAASAQSLNDQAHVLRSAVQVFRV